MTRLQFQFGCGSLKLAGSLDTAPGSTGLLLVSGGSEIRSGAFSGQSHFAARIAKKGFPVFRFDRRGIGDSEGENRGFRSSQGDIRAALQAFRGMVPSMNRVFAFGNCDAASALMLMRGEGFDGLVLSNPWTIEDERQPSTEPQQTPKAIRIRYAEKLKNPGEIARLLRGDVDFGKMARGLRSSLSRTPAPSKLAVEMRERLTEFNGHVSLLLAERDRTAQLFEAAWDKADPRLAWCKGAGHAYVEPAHRDWLEQRVLEALRS